MEYLLFQPDSVPATVTDPDTAAVNLGVRFKPAVSGKVVGIRFYKGPQNTGSHVIAVWDSAGKRLRAQTVNVETPQGWQEKRFDTPVPVTAGATYVAAYHAPRGRYSSTAAYFTVVKTVGKLTTSVGAGVYRYGGTSAFPNQVYNNCNYWVSPIFDDLAVVQPPPPPPPPPPPGD